MVALVGLEVCQNISNAPLSLGSRVKRTIKLETNELPHCQGETQRPPLDTVMNDVSTIGLMLRAKEIATPISLLYQDICGEAQERATRRLGLQNR